MDPFDFILKYDYYYLYISYKYDLIFFMYSNFNIP